MEFIYWNMGSSTKIARYLYLLLLYWNFKLLCWRHTLKSSRNLYQKLAPETCTKSLVQVHHSFLHHNKSLANHVARFVSHARQFLCWNRAVFYCVQETCTRKNCTRLTDTCASVLVSGTSFLSMLNCKHLLYLAVTVSLFVCLAPYIVFSLYGE